MRTRAWAIALTLCAACDATIESDVGVAPSDAGGPIDAGADAAANDAGEAHDAEELDVASSDAGARRTAAEWIIDHFAGDPEVTGTLSGRQFVETPVLVRDATGCCGKYAFDLRAAEAPDRREAGFVRVMVAGLTSPDRFGGAIYTANAAGAVVYLADVTIDPGWPTFVSYDVTNSDGMVLDDSEAIYGEDVTIRDWNSDGGIDNKASVSQFVRLRIEGTGYRAIRYWAPGPHYLVASSIARDDTVAGGALLWFADCDSVALRVYDSTFDGSPTVPSSAIDCDTGSAPSIEYLTVDPRTTGEMHEMFTAP